MKFLIFTGKFRLLIQQRLANRHKIWDEKAVDVVLGHTGKKPEFLANLKIEEVTREDPDYSLGRFRISIEPHFSSSIMNSYVLRKIKSEIEKEEELSPYSSRPGSPDSTLTRPLSQLSFATMTDRTYSRASTSDTFFCISDTDEESQF